MASSCPGVAALDRVEAILRNPELYDLAGLIPQPSREKGGRSRDYPNFMYLAYEALISVYASARQVEAELAHKVAWKLMRRTVKKMFPDDEAMRLPSKPMRRHHYLYGRNRYLSNSAVLEGLAKLHRELAAGQARELGLMDPDGPGSWTHPDLSRMLYSDGKVITPLYKTRPGDEWVDKKTGEIKQRRYEPDADLHFEGTGEVAYGTKFVLVAVRSEEIRGRMILDLEWVPDKGGEAKVAMSCFQRLHPLVPGAQGVIYDTALRGTHHQVLLREMGLLPVNRVTAAVAGSKEPRRAEGRRVEKSVHVEDREVVLAGGSKRTVHLYARACAIGLGELTDTGELDFVELPRLRTHRNQDASGLFRWYNEYALPELYGCKHLMVRLHGNDEDVARKFNRTENVRPIAPSDPEFKAIYSRRSDSESINRGLEDTLYVRRKPGPQRRARPPAREPARLRTDGQLAGAPRAPAAAASRLSSISRPPPRLTLREKYVPKRSTRPRERRRSPGSGRSPCPRRLKSEIGGWSKLHGRFSSRFSTCPALVGVVENPIKRRSGAKSIPGLERVFANFRT